MGPNLGIACLTVGIFFACCGWNKLFDQRRSTEMWMTMHRVPLVSREPWMWARLVAMVELVFGLLLVVALPLNTGPGAALFAVPLLCVCVVGFAFVAYHDMMRQWKPGNFLDHIATWLYMPEVLVDIFCVQIIMGAL